MPLESLHSGSYWTQWSKGQRLSETLFYHVLHNILGTHQGGFDRAPNPTDDIADMANEVVYAPDENQSNPSRVAKHQ